MLNFGKNYKVFSDTCSLNTISVPTSNEAKLVWPIKSQYIA